MRLRTTMLRSMSAKGLFLCALLCDAVLAFAQDHFEAIPTELRPLYRYNYARNFFPSEVAEKEDRKTIEAVLKEVDGYVVTADSSAESLYRTLESLDRAELMFGKHDLYLFLRFATDITDQAAIQGPQELRAMMRPRRRAVRAKLLAISDSGLAEMMMKYPRLERYRYAIE